MSTLTRRRFLRGAAATGVVLAGSGLYAGCQRVPFLLTEPSPRPVRLGFLALTSAAEYAPYVDAFRAGLHDLGYGSGRRELVIEERYAQGRAEDLPALASELIERHVDVLVTASTQAGLAAVHATHTIPIVFTNSGDPLGAGLVASLARPGGNATGLTSLNRELAGKRLELLKTALPSISRVAVLWADAAERDVAETRATAFWLGIQTEDVRVASPDELESSLARVLATRPHALIAISTPLINSFRGRIAEFTREHRLPSISEQREFAAAGGLMAYGANLVELSQRAAMYVDKILAGAPPADLPVERAERFEVVLNLRAAQGLNLVLPQSMLLQATEVLS